MRGQAGEKAGPSIQARARTGEAGRALAVASAHLTIKPRAVPQPEAP